MFMWEPDEQLLTRCAELGVIACAVAAPTQDLAAWQSFLDRYLQIADRIGLSLPDLAEEHLSLTHQAGQHSKPPWCSPALC